MTTSRPHHVAEKEVRQKAFETCGRQPYTWVDFAESHRAAANLVLARFKGAIEANRSATETKIVDFGIGLSPTYKLLAGLSLENLLKAICIATNPALIAGGSLKPWPGSSHDLRQLASLAGLTVTHREQTLLERLGTCIDWYGRYPIPMTWHRPMPQGLVFESESDMVDWLANDPPLIEALFDRLSQFMRQLEAKRKLV